jgi:hypothetical protein
MIAVVVEKEECFGIGEAMGEVAECSSDKVETVDGAQRLLYPPPAPRLAIFLNACAIASKESGGLDPSPPASFCTRNCESETSCGSKRARKTPTSRPTREDFRAIAMT